MEEVKVIGSWGSAYCHRVIWGLKHKGVEYEYKEEDVTNKSEELIRYNPVYQRIPVLVHNGKSIVESILILEYIEEMWPHNPLLPSHPYHKAMARFWTKYLEDKSPIFYSYFRATGEEQERLAKEAKQVLETIEEKGLGDKPFFGGNQFGYTDLCMGWIGCWLQLIQQAAGIELLESRNLPRLHAWSNRFQQLPVIKDNVPEKSKMLAYFKGLRQGFIASSTP